METTQNPPKADTRIDVYEKITDKIIEQLEKGTVPWRQPWHGEGMPRNLTSGRVYRGINIMLLSYLGYDQNYFLTFKQIAGMGGRVKKGEKGHIVVYWNWVEKELTESEKSEGAHDKVPYLRYYFVFNIAQCENIPADKIPIHVAKEFDPIPVCEAIVRTMPLCPAIKYKQQKAYYDALHDFVNMPKPKSFESEQSYYATLFHELVHSTGHNSRLDRKDLIQMAEFGSEPYSHEELVAEIGTCYLLSFVGITDQFEQNAAYIQGWLAKLKNDKKFIFSAARHAQKATDYILNVQSEAEESSEE